MKHKAAKLLPWSYPADSRTLPGNKCLEGRPKVARATPSWQMGEGRIRSYSCEHRLPIPQPPLPTTHPAPHAAPLERKYRKQLAVLALGLAGRGPAKALSFPFHRHRGCSGCFCFPLAAQESRQRDSGWPSPREQGSPGYRSLPQVSGTAGCRLPAALLPGSLPALLGPGLGTGVGSQPQRKHVDTRTGRGEKGLMDGWMDKQMGYGRAGMVLCIQGASVTCSRAASRPGSFQ